MSEVTLLLDAAAGGDRKAAAELLPLVYGELRKLAAARMAEEAGERTLQPTALVHEAYLRLVGPAEENRWNSRGHFFGAAAEAMRRILIDDARRRKADKRGGDFGREELHPDIAAAKEKPENLLALDEALDRLAEEDAVKADVVKLRFFGGLTLPQAAAALGISERTAGRHWSYARAWLREAVEGAG